MSAELAREGKLDELFQSMGSDGDRDREIYKWLCAAEDFGHDAEDTIGDLLECSSLRYDDDGYEQAAAHWELACAYLLGSEGLQVDLVLGAKHLERAFEEFTLAEISAGTQMDYDAAGIAAQLEPEARAVLEKGLTRDPYRAVVRRVDRLRQLREIGSVPQVIIQTEARLLMEAVVELIGEDASE